MQSFDPHLSFNVACKTDCGKKKKSAACSVHWCYVDVFIYLIVVLGDGLLDLGIVAVADVAVEILVVVLVFLNLKVGQTLANT